MRNRTSAVAAFNLILEPQDLRLCINTERRVDRGFFYMVRISTGEIVRRNVDLHELGRSLRTDGTLPSPRPRENEEPDDGGPVLPPGPAKTI